MFLREQQAVLDLGSIIGEIAAERENGPQFDRAGASRKIDRIFVSRF